MSILKSNKQLVLAKERLQNRELVEITEDNKNEYYEFVDKSINPKPLTNDEPCDWDLITSIFQNAIKRKGLTKEEVKEISDKILYDK